MGQKYTLKQVKKENKNVNLTELTDLMIEKQEEKQRGKNICKMAEKITTQSPDVINEAALNDFDYIMR